MPEPPILQVEVEQDQPDWCAIALSGEATFSSGSLLEQTLAGQLKKHSLRTMILNCSRLLYIDSFALGILFQAYGTLKKRNGLLCLVRVEKDLNRILSSTRLNRLIPILDSMEEALEIHRKNQTEGTKA